MDGSVARFHALDALRATMMLLGLVLHSMASYTATPLGEAWPLQDMQTSRHFELPLFVIHLFRMPAFFVVAGFFAALLYERDGVAGFIRNRATRVLLPLIVFWALVGPLVLGAFYFAMTRTGRITGPELLATSARVELAALSPLHLWFLWYLVLFYAVTLAVLVVPGCRSLPLTVAERLTTSRWSLPIWGSVTTLTLLPMSHAGIDGSPMLLAHPRTLVAYGVFFLFGWLLFRGRRGIERLAGWCSWRAPLLALPVLVASYLAASVWSASLPMGHAVRCVFVAFSMWALVLTSLGAFVKYAGLEQRPVRYLSDGAYWIYIIHLPIAVFAVGWLAPHALPAALKFTIVLAVTAAVSVATYHLFVRRTVIGQLLNGRRIPARQ